MCFPVFSYLFLFIAILGDKVPKLKFLDKKDLCVLIDIVIIIFQKFCNDSHS